MRPWEREANMTSETAPRVMTDEGCTRTRVTGLRHAGTPCAMELRHPSRDDPYWRIIVWAIPTQKKAHYSRRGSMTLREVLADFGVEIEEEP